MTDCSLRRAARVVLVQGEEGMVLVTALLMLVVLTLMGVAAMSMRNTERSITVNDEIAQHNFYVVEAVTLEGVARIEGLDDETLNAPSAFGWLRPDTTPGIDLEQTSQWGGPVVPEQTTKLIAPLIDIRPPGYSWDGTSAKDRICYAALDRGIAPGSSVTYGSGSGGATKVERMFSVYGMYDVKAGGGKTYHGKKLLVVGYKKQVDSP